MIIQCESCSRKFNVKNTDIPKEGRMVQCGYCSTKWHYKPEIISTKSPKKLKTKNPSNVTDDSPSVDSIKASDGKTYRFLGSQWAELLPSGKTGLFARKKISKELDEITGRKEKKISKKRKKRLYEVNPSSESLSNDKKQSQNISQTKQGLGFFSYFFLIIIIGFSIVGMLRTFENDLLNYFPQMEYIYLLLNEQSEYFAETIKNMITIINDLINTY
tara:strand:+ start:63 stop:713 length:651 start_codon:yes stop_codon:yes gene_type:complete